MSSQQTQKTDDEVRTDICNRALAALGHDRTITSLTQDDSTEALRCRAFFETALNDTLYAHNWDFATEEYSLKPSCVDKNGFAKFSQPEDFVRLVSVTDMELNPLKITRSRSGISVQNDGKMIRVKYVSNDIALQEAPPPFIDVVVYKLASLIASPMYGDARKAEEFINIAEMKLSKAIAQETDETSYRGEWENPFISARL